MYGNIPNDKTERLKNELGENKLKNSMAVYIPLPAGIDSCTVCGDIRMPGSGIFDNAMYNPANIKVINTLFFIPDSANSCHRLARNSRLSTSILFLQFQEKLKIL
jgi:hypothetical protein